MATQIMVNVERMELSTLLSIAVMLTGRCSEWWMNYPGPWPRSWTRMPRRPNGHLYTLIDGAGIREWRPILYRGNDGVMKGT